MRKILVTSALPYANGNLHIGHILEFVQADIWVRYKKLIGNKCVYISGIDSHGTPIMLKANSYNVSFEYLINSYFLSHKTDLNNFSISLDNYYSTNSYENEFFSKKIYRKLYEKNLIFETVISQFYDSIHNIFLPDRYVLGTCPYCKSNDQYGDICNVCNRKYDAVDLLNPISILSLNCRRTKKSIHFFFNLKGFRDFLSSSCNFFVSQESVLNKLMEWLDFGLKDWDISRDYPYFGFKFPGEYKKFFYVWLDAPIGYLSFFFNFLLNKDLIYFNCFRKNLNEYDIYHFIGKDIVYFHALFWPSILLGINFKKFNNIFVHGFVTIDGFKMSKSNNTFINACDFLGLLDSDCLRFYLASKLNQSVSDIDFSFLDFSSKINSDLIGKFFNIISRCSKILINHYSGLLSSELDSPSLFFEYLNLKEFLFAFYEKRDYSKIIFHVMKYADKINSYLDSEKPWILLKDLKTRKKAQEVCTTAINLFFILLFFLKPVIPNLFERLSLNLNLDLNHLSNPFLSLDISGYEHLIYRY